jgi:threonylcarbamoyladenosine tRNA methylthiotransferase MtaB
MNAAIFTLGCRLNQAESALMADNLREHGFHIVPWGSPADLLVINGCIVTAAAGQKTRQAARKARRQHPDAFIVVAGCIVNVEAEHLLAEPALDLLVPNPGKDDLCQHLPRPLTRCDSPRLAQAKPAENLFREANTGYYPEHTRANLKIQEGCNFFCSYCIVPYARGVPRSREWDDVLREAQELIARGHREIVLTGVNVATYRDHGRTLADLLRTLADLPGEFRLRLSSTEPGEDLPRLIDVMAAFPEKICRFLHLSLQYGEDSILKAMNRRYTVAEFARWAEYAARRLPGICLGSDVIVGFPGETESTFAQCCQTVEALPLTYLHIFSFSPRKGTPAATMKNQVPGNIADERHRRLAELAEAKELAFTDSQLNQTLTVLTETRNAAGNFEGWSDNYLKVEIVEEPSGAACEARKPPPVAANQFVTVRPCAITGARQLRGHCSTPAESAQTDN